MSRLPEFGTSESQEWCKKWDGSTSKEKLQLCQQYGTTYGYGAQYRLYCRQQAKEPQQVSKLSWQEHLDLHKQIRRATEFHTNIPTELSVKIDTDKPIAIPFTADWHLGAVGVDYDAFERDMYALANEAGAKAYIGGDGYENIIQPSKIGSAHNQAPVVDQRGFYVLTMRWLIRADSLLCVGTGNHNWWTTMATGEDWDRELAERLNVLYTGHVGILYLTVGDMVYPILRMHQSRFNSSFNLTHTCKQMQRMYCPGARVIVAEHKHQAAMEQYEYDGRDCVAIRPGTYKTYDSYALQYGYWGQTVANPTVVLYPDRDEVVPFKDMYAAFKFTRAERCS